MDFWMPETNNSSEEFEAKLNQMEYEFRTKIRFQNPKYRGWKIDRTYTKTLIDFNYVYHFRLTQYYVFNENKKKKKFVFYHHEFLKNNQGRFSNQVIKSDVKKYLSNQPMDFLSPKSARYHIDKSNFKHKLVNENESLLEQLQSKEWDEIQVNADDCYINVRNKVKKFTSYKKCFLIRNLTFIFVSKLDKNVKKMCLNFTKSKSFKGKKQFLDQVLNETKNMLEKFKFKKLYVIGDGAKWIKKLANFVSGSYVLDKFHLYKKMIFWTPNSRIKDKICRTFVGDKTIINWINDWRYFIENRLESEYCKSVKEFKKLVFSSEISESLTKEIFRILNYIQNNWLGIWVTKSEFLVSRTENSINHLVKKLIKKAFVSLTERVAEMKIQYQNVFLKSIATYFL
ncbi:Mbov_0401 family ICE element transposase-like protein [Mycoplasma sp. 392]